MSFLSSLFGKPKPPPEFPLGKVRFDETRVTYTCGSRVDMIDWRDLAEVGIVTTDEGPIQEDVYFLLLDETKKKGCSVPQGADGGQQLLERLQALPDFNHEAVIRAMGSTGNDRFVCWKRKNA